MGFEKIISDERIEKGKDRIKKITNSGIFNKIKSIKNIEIKLAIMLCAIILAVYLIGSGIAKGKSEEEIEIERDASVSQQLEKILSQIKGVGKVKVLITFDGEGELVPAQSGSKYTYSTSDEKGQTSTTTETNNTVIVSGDKGNTALILKEIAPKVLGVIVVAEGAEDPKVKIALMSATSAATGADIDKIKIFEMD